MTAALMHVEPFVSQGRGYSCDVREGEKTVFGWDTADTLRLREGEGVSIEGVRDGYLPCLSLKTRL